MNRGQRVKRIMMAPKKAHINPLGNDYRARHQESFLSVDHRIAIEPVIASEEKQSQ